MRRGILKNIRRLVVKVGTKLLVNERGRLDPLRIDHIAAELASACRLGIEVVLVTSGAIVAGLECLGYRSRPKDLPKLQAAAAIGQGQLMHLYQGAFSKHERVIAQILLTWEDLKERRRHVNARNTFGALLAQGVIPIVNENDTVSVEEIKFGDNDELSALVASLIGADLLVLLTDQEGFLRDGEVVHTIFEIDGDIEQWAHRERDWKGTGGMRAKLSAARMMMRSGEFMVIANGYHKGVIENILDDRKTGTLFVPKGLKMSGKKRWIAHFVKPLGILTLDSGAVTAILEQGRSLLMPGVRSAQGSFHRGDTVSLCNEAGKEVARGLVNYTSEEVIEFSANMKEPQTKNAVRQRREVVHRNNLVIL